MNPTKKLIEVALPLPEINDASAYDKMPGIGPHPKGIHHWWARLPLPTARAILFASVVDDPSEHPEKFKTEAAQDEERERLFGLVRELMDKKLHTRPEIYAKARAEMEKYCNGKLPPVLDPFSGGGSIPLEANRLGFEARAADLNPVAVLLNKCNLELAPRWVGHAPVNPDDRNQIGGKQNWKGTHGLAADVRYYGSIVRDRAIAKIGSHYPKIKLPHENGGGEATVIAWLWARTVASSNPAAHGKHVPLVRSFSISSKGEKTWIDPVVDKKKGTIAYVVRQGGTPRIKGTVTRTGAVCLLSDQPISLEHIRAEGRAGRLGQHLIAVVAEGRRGKIFLSPDAEQEAAAQVAMPEGYPDTDLPTQALGFRIQNYGFTKHYQMFTRRQLSALVLLSDLVREIRSDVLKNAREAGMAADASVEYSKTVSTFLALSLNRLASFNNSFCRWNGNQTVFIFTRAAIPMLWDYAEANVIGEKAICWSTSVDICADSIETLLIESAAFGSAQQADASQTSAGERPLLVSTDPPYYDNIGYAALSDFYYVWLRRTVGDLFPSVCSTVLVPKMPELTASPELFDGDREKAKEHFEGGFRKTFTALRGQLDQRFPLTVYYAFKQDDEGEADESLVDAENSVDLTTGWETLLEALVSSGFQITATWPVRASFEWRMRSLQSNALASYIVLACRPRPADSPQVGRRDFLSDLKREMPFALKHLQQGNVAPVDFAQASIGPGMAVYSRYSRILESDGKPMTVRTALSLINQIKEEVLGEPESDYDPETRWALVWFDQNGFADGDFGDANTLATAHAISVAGLRDAGLVNARGGNVRLLSPADLPKDWSPAADRRPTVWEMTHHLVRLYHVQGAGEAATADLLRQLGARSDAARDLAYRLFSIAERRKRSADAQGYNALVLGWPELARLAQEAPKLPRAADGELNLT